MTTFNPNTLSADNQRGYYRLLSVIEKRGSPRNNHSLSNCWTHRTSVSSSGYGQLTWNEKLWNLHRLSWWLHNGCPEDGDFYKRDWHICHECDNKECANPEHLKLETCKKNIEDAVKRIRVIKPKKEPIRTTVACNACRADTHHKCEGFPCSLCVKNGIECVKEEWKPHSATFKKGDHTGEKNVKCKMLSKTVFEIRQRIMNGLKYGELKTMAEEYKITYVTIQAIAGRIGHRDEPEAKPEGWDEFVKKSKG